MWRWFCEPTGIEELSDQWSRILRMKFQVEGTFSHIQSYSVIFSPDAKQFFIILNVLATGTETPSRDHASDREEAERFKTLEDLGDRLFKGGSICT
jgi:kynurenine formamidase